ncbi:unnamed protein product [Bemisia tabaci]|uniref:Replication protein A OB domain-containing protein n=1 Tax=Bemisia tabaci TaxID=7038 RepID=A0A9N9ZY57_BEMTA|nr:unnamed protein product [Bemisia tabaci]
MSRCALITGMRQFKKEGNKSGFYFNFEVENSSGSIRGVCYEKDTWNQLEQETSYEIRNFVVRKSKKQSKHDFELLFHKSTEIKECPDMTIDVPKKKFKFVGDILSSDSNIIDVIGIIGCVSEEKQVQTKKGTETLRREITIRDHNLSSMNLILWGEQTS